MRSISSQFRKDSDLKTTDQKLFESFMEQSGLPEGAARALFESKGFEALDTQFQQFDAIQEFHEIDTTSNTNIIDYVNKSKDSNPIELAKSILLVLHGKNPNSEEIETLCESFEIQYSGAPILQKANLISEDIKLYTDLRSVLTELNMEDNNVEIRSTFKKIIKYLESEIEYLSNKENVQVIDNSEIQTIVRELIENRLSPHHKDIKIMRELVSDVQLLVYECVQIVALYMQQNKDFARYISVDQINRFADSYNNVLRELYSVREKSIVYDLYRQTEDANVNDDNVVSIRQTVEISYQTVQDACILIKNCTSDFNMKIRGMLNTFITNSLSFSERIYNIKRRLVGNGLIPTVNFGQY